jgi:hypothetical protein
MRGFERAARWLPVLALFALGVPAPAGAGAKRYFLTTGSFAGNAALTACGKGFHMASLWEILDPTVLRYDAKRGDTREDSGSGPAAELGGWVRTGTASSASANAGVGNCNAWTSNSAADQGTAVELNGTWTDPAAFSSPWIAFSATCDSTIPVWCKQN